MRELFKSTADRLFGDLVTPALMESTRHGDWPGAFWESVEAAGFSTASAPEALGGTGSPWNDLYVIVHAAGRYNVPAPLPEALMANWLLGQAKLECVAGPLSFAADSTLTMQNGRVTGKLADVPFGRHVTHVVALLSQGGSSSVVLLHTDHAFALKKRLNIAGESRDDLLFSDAAPIAYAALPQGMPADLLLLGGALLRSAQIAGALETVLEMTSRYATERSQFGRPISGFQAIQHQLAVLAEHAAAATVAAEAAFALSGDAPAVLPIMSAKVVASEAASLAAGIAHAVHGAIGVTDEHALHFTTQRLWSWRSEFGSPTFWAQRLGREVCKAGAAQFWPAMARGEFGRGVAMEGAQP